MRTYTLLVKGEKIPVSREVYNCYYKCYERERYLQHLNYKFGCSWESLDSRGVQVDFHSRSGQGEDPLSILIREERRLALIDALITLREGPRYRFITYVLDDLSERALAFKEGRSRSSIHRELKNSQEILRTFLLGDPRFRDRR